MKEQGVSGALRNVISLALIGTLVLMLASSTAFAVNKSGNSGDNRIVGTNKADRLDGGVGGDDDLIGRGGNDRLTSGNGNARLEGGFGDDYINGGCGRNTVFGGAGDDRIFASARCRGEEGGARKKNRDRIDCGPGFDTVTIYVGRDGQYEDEISDNCERIRTR